MAPLIYFESTKLLIKKEASSFVYRLRIHHINVEDKVHGGLDKVSVKDSQKTVHNWFDLEIRQGRCDRNDQRFLNDMISPQVDYYKIRLAHYNPGLSLVDKGTMANIAGVDTFLYVFTMAFIGDMKQQMENSGFL